MSDPVFDADSTHARPGHVSVQNFSSTTAAAGRGLPLISRGGLFCWVLELDIAPQDRLITYGYSARLARALIGVTCTYPTPSTHHRSNDHSRQASQVTTFYPSINIHQSSFWSRFPSGPHTHHNCGFDSETSPCIDGPSFERPRACCGDDSDFFSLVIKHHKRPRVDIQNIRKKSFHLISARKKAI